MCGFPVLAPNTMSLDRVSADCDLPDDFNIIIEILAGVERYRNVADKSAF